MILEPDVALSDFALALACFGFTSWLTTRTNQNSPTRAFMTFFAAIGTAALLGGVAHGFLPDHGTPLYSAVWTSMLIAIGVATLASWIIGARLILSAVNPKIDVVYTSRMPHRAAATLLPGSPILWDPCHPHQLANVIAHLRSRPAETADASAG